MTNTSFSPPVGQAKLTQQQCDQALEIVKPVVEQSEPQLKKEVSEFIIDSVRQFLSQSGKRIQTLESISINKGKFSFNTKEGFSYVGGTLSFHAKLKDQKFVLDVNSRIEARTSISNKSAAFSAYIALVRRGECGSQHAQYTKLKEEILKRVQQGGFDSAIEGLGMIKGGSPTSPLRSLPKKSK